MTRKRLYLETMEKVLKRSGKIVLDTQKSGVLPYLPLDRLQGGAGAGQAKGGAAR